MPDIGVWTPKLLGPYAWYDAHLGGYSTGIVDLSGYGRPDATNGGGSSAAAWLPWDKKPNVFLPGVAGNYVSCPDAASLDVTGDIDILVRLLPLSWTAATGSLVAKYTGSARAYRLDLNSSGTLRMYLTTDGSTEPASSTSSASVGFSNGQPGWVRATWRASDGRVQYFTAPDSDFTPTSWTQLGTDKSLAIPSIYSGNAPLEVGASFGGTAVPFAGEIFRAIVRNGIGGPAVADFDASLCTQAGYTGALGNVWTVNRSSTGRKSVVQGPAANATRGLYLLGTDDWIAVPGSAIPPSTASSNCTYVLVARTWPTPNSFGRMFSTQPTSASADKGVYFMHSSATSMQARFADGTTLNGIGSNNQRNGIREVYAAVALSNGQSFTFYQSEQNLGTVSLAAVGDRSSSGGRIGSNLNGTSFQDMEFEALLTFDRALTASEIAQIVAYYRGGL